MKWPNFRWLAPALMLLGGCALAQPVSARSVTARSTYAAPALWTVKDADTTIYLFGTVHVLKPGIDWFKGGIKSAFDRSDELVLEIVEPEDPSALASTMAGTALARDGVKLSDRLNAEERARYQSAMAANGLPWQAFEMFNPWMAGMALSVQPLEKLGYKADLGAEKVLSAAAKASGKKIGALETVEQQLGYFAGLPMAQQVKFLTTTIEGLPDMDREFASLVKHWQGGEPDKLAAEMNESLEATPELARVLLIQRNANWAKWIKQRLDQPGTVFIAVGAGHLAGKDSVQDQLKALGVSSVRVKQ
ncbi:TraB/GumN family protein [Sphingobium sp. EM0848]|uniref:TraB/GumN family protein n=1 Tax=Sphingobium sp. EM0848 TaxID=2743473 RepID=UPI00159C791D|nr:TraB/GumN family protein [Sphingobium sp. EM0848]